MIGDGTISGTAMMEILGNHILLDMWGIAGELLDDAASLEAGFVGSAERGGAHVVDARFCRFAPHGISGVVILAESHLTVHTWPEHGYAAVDVFTCGADEVAEKIAEEVLASLRPDQHQVRRLRRGLPGGTSPPLRAHVPVPEQVTPERRG